MFSFKTIVLISAAFAVGVECSHPGSPNPVIVPTHLGYVHSVPQNIPPYASQIQIERKVINPIVAGPAVAAYTAPVASLAAPIAARYAPAAIAAPVASGPYIAAAPYSLPGPFAPYSYAAASPLLRTPFGVAPAFVR